MNMVPSWQGICPECGSFIGELLWPAIDVDCNECSITYRAREGILQLINNKRLHLYETFLDEYTRIRRAEGRGSQDAGYYLQLPAPCSGDPLAWQWKIRMVSYNYLQNLILHEISRPLKIADLGAGVGWLSNRLASLGHNPVAIDLSIDSFDGLAAGKHYGGKWPRVQAEFDRLPLADNQADMIIFNASLHYSTDYITTIGEALRVLGKNGRIVVMDSPVYKRAVSGEQMRIEKHRNFEEQFGMRSDSINSIEFLTWNMLDELGMELGLDWQIISPWYGWRRAFRPLTAKIAGKREPSQFALLIATRKKER